MNKKLKLVLIAGVVLVGVCCGLFAYIESDIQRSWESRNAEMLEGRNHPSQVATAFATALRINHEVAYKISNPELWPRIQTWMDTNQIVDCSPWDFSDEGHIAVGGGTRSENEFNFDVFFSCKRVQGYTFTFDVYDIIVQRNNQGEWVIIDWASITTN